MRGGLLLLLLGLTGCGLGGGSGGDSTLAPPELPDVEQKVRIEKLWDGGVSGPPGAMPHLRLRPALVPEPDSEGRLYVAGGKGDIVAVLAESGKRLWKRATKKWISGGVGAGEDLVAVGTTEGEVLAFSAATGEPLWEAQVSSEVLAAPAVAGGTVAVRTQDGKLFGLSTESGRQQWVYSASLPALTLRGTSAPVVQEDVVIAGFDDGRLVAVLLDSGQPAWELTVSDPSGRTELERIVDNDAELEIRGNEVFVAAYQGQLIKALVPTGTLGWSYPLSTYSGLGSSEEHVYAASEKGVLHALDRSTGELVWEQDLLQRRILSAPEAIGPYLVCGDEEGYLHWFSRSDGSPQGRTRAARAPIRMAPQAWGNVLYVYAVDGRYAAYAYR